MSFVETGLVVGKDNKALRWHEPEGASGGFLPDSQRVFLKDQPLSGGRALWEFFRDNWKSIRGFAHTHPNGYSGPSWTDVTTFAAIELGLDLRFDWWIVTGRIALVRWKGPGIHDYETTYYPVDYDPWDPTWANELRAKSRREEGKELSHG